MKDQPAENVNSNTMAMDQTAIFRDYVKILHVMIVGLLIVVACFGVIRIVEYKERQQLVAQMTEVVKQRDELILENIRLKEVTRPTRQKIDRGAVYIHKTYGVPMDVAMQYSRSEMVNALKQNIPFSVGLAQTSLESGFNPTAISPNGCCVGPKQIHYRVWSREKPWITMDMLKDPIANTAIGYMILREYYDASGSLFGALMRYSGNTDPIVNIDYAERVVRRSQEIARFLS